VPAEIKASYPDIPWRVIAGMRDRLAHGYFGIDYVIVWDVVGKRKTVDFVSPVYEIERQDNIEIRQLILDISYVEWKKWGSQKALYMI
jgi:hypothetical protein